jgi:hypothetical protein
LGTVSQAALTVKFSRPMYANGFSLDASSTFRLESKVTSFLAAA